MQKQKLINEYVFFAVSNLSFDEIKDAKISFPVRMKT
jgi:hypothetical protein